MASIVNNPKYGEGHKVAFSSKISDDLKRKIVMFSYKPVDTIFSLTSANSQAQYNLIQIGTDRNTDSSVFMKDPSNKLVKIKGSKTNIESSFIHAIKTGKSDTNALTTVKELISMWQFEAHVERGSFLSEDQIIEKLGNMKQHYTTTYNESAIKQAKALKSKIKSRGYTYERQKENITKDIYAKAGQLTKKAPDNWNPADVWMIKSGLDISPILISNTPAELNGKIAKYIQDEYILPISLKQVTKNTASMNLIDPSQLLSQKINLDFTLGNINLTSSFNNFMIETVSGFTVRGGFKGSSSTLSVSLEGSFKGAGSQLGGIDAKEYAKHVKNMHGYDIRSGTKVSPDNYKTAIDELKQLFDKYKSISKSITDFKQAVDLLNSGNDLLRLRSINIISYLYSFLAVPGNEKFEDHMTMCYFLSKKVTSDSSSYYLISNG